MCEVRHDRRHSQKAVGIRRSLRALLAVLVVIMTALSTIGMVAFQLLPSQAAGNGDGSNSGGGLGNGGKEFKPYYFWEDDAEAALNGNPIQGWNDDSVEWALRKMNSMVGDNLAENAVSNGLGVSYGSYYRKIARQAIENAKADAGTTRARIVSVAWIAGDVQDAAGNKLPGYTLTNWKNVKHWSDVVTRPGNSSELRPWSYWSQPKDSSESRSWAQRLYDVYVVGDSQTQFRLGVIAVAEGQPAPPEGDFEVAKTSSNPTLANKSGAYDNAAVFAVYDAGGAQVDTIYTNASGYGKSKKLSPGTYTYREITPSKGHNVNSTTYTVTVVGGKTIPAGATVSNPLIPWRLQAVKTDPDGNTIAKAGFVFELCETIGGAAIETRTTGADGVATFQTDLALGKTYYVHEKTVIGNYVLNKSYIPVTASQQGTTSPVRVSVNVPNEKKTTQIEVWKTDDVKGWEIPQAVFEVIATREMSDLDGVQARAGQVMDTLVTDSRGYAISRKLPTDTNGNGYYKVVEKSVPQPYSFTTFEKDASSTNATQDRANTVVTVRATNTPVTADLSLDKRESNTNGVVEGAEFDIVAAADIKWANGQRTVISAGTVVDHIRTDANGHAQTTKPLYLNYQGDTTYNVVETSVGAPYAWNTKSTSVSFSYKGEPHGPCLHGDGQDERRRPLLPRDTQEGEREEQRHRGSRVPAHHQGDGDAPERQHRPAHEGGRDRGEVREGHRA